MQHGRRWLAGALLIAALASSGCAGTAETASSDEQPVKLAQVSGSQLQRVVLSPRAAERIGIATARVTAVPGAGRATRAVPFSAILYDSDGRTWVYVTPAARTYVRSPVVVDRIRGNTALLARGPAVGALVVTVGGPELLGAEYGVGEGE